MAAETVLQGVETFVDGVLGTVQLFLDFFGFFLYSRFELVEEWCAVARVAYADGALGRKTRLIWALVGQKSGVFERRLTLRIFPAKSR